MVDWEDHLRRGDIKVHAAVAVHRLGADLERGHKIVGQQRGIEFDTTGASCIGVANVVVGHALTLEDAVLEHHQGFPFTVGIFEEGRACLLGVVHAAIEHGSRQLANVQTGRAAYIGQGGDVAPAFVLIQVVPHAVLQAVLSIKAHFDRRREFALFIEQHTE